MDLNTDIINQILEHRLRQSDIFDMFSNLDYRERDDFMRKIAEILGKLSAILKISSRVCNVLSLDLVLMRMMEISNEAMDTEGSTVFLNDASTNELFSRVLHGEVMEEIRIPNDTGIAGTVFQSGESAIIGDAYADTRFNAEVDKKTGFKTRNILCAPMRTRNNEIIGVVQLLNKKSGTFNSDDIKLIEGIASQASVAFQNAQLYEAVMKAKEEETQLLDITTAISSELQLKQLLFKIMETTSSILNAERSTLFLYDENTQELYSQVAMHQNAEIRIPRGTGIAGAVFERGETINIPDAYADPRFNTDVDKQTGFITRSILCMPVINKEGKAIGVTQVLNKKGGPFTHEDERRLKAFSAQSSIAIENAKLFEEILNIKNYNESILESMSNAVISLNEKNHIVKCNTAAARLFGIIKGVIIGVDADVFFSKNNWIIQSVRKINISNISDTTFDTELILRGGKSAYVNLTVFPLINTNRDNIGTVLIFEDITQEKRVKETISRYMSKEVVEKLLEGGEAVLGGTTQQVTILFSDIRNFTAISEKLTSKETVAMLNDYFTVMVDIILKHHGVLDKYIGDSIMAIYGIPFKHTEDADRAVKTAIDMLAALKAYNEARAARSLAGTNIGIGINTGDVLVGNIGSLKRMEYTVIGDEVNLASRLEDANKLYGTNILISEQTYKALKGSYTCREIDKLRVYGKNRAVAVYEVIAEGPGKEVRDMEAFIGMFNEGVKLYRQRSWQKALGKFKETLRANPNDGVSRIYTERCETFISFPPDDNWDGIWALSSKMKDYQKI
ncbi:MAG: GAF domain-containing protein [Nitrospirae bacterium]|nr:GAF domain-containing protein [Nitrospirota bacterium]